MKNNKEFKVPEGFPVPLSKSVILEKIQIENKTKGGVILMEDAEENNVARLMAFAPDCFNAPFLKVGQKVMYNVLENRTIRFEENTYLIMTELALFCILPEKSTLIPESINPRIKSRKSKLDAQQKRLNEDLAREMNNLDRVKEMAKKKFNKKH
jgi:co-chaperonin GroES (HSP10)